MIEKSDNSTDKISVKQCLRHRSTRLLSIVKKTFSLLDDKQVLFIIYHSIFSRQNQFQKIIKWQKARLYATSSDFDMANWRKFSPF